MLSEEGEAGGAEAIALANALREGKIEASDAELERMHPSDVAAVVEYRSRDSKGAVPMRGVDEKA